MGIYIFYEWTMYEWMIAENKEYSNRFYIQNIKELLNWIDKYDSKIGVRTKMNVDKHITKKSSQILKIKGSFILLYLPKNISCMIIKSITNGIKCFNKFEFRNNKSQEME